MSGPLSGIRIIEFTGLGPAPFCGMMLADQGAQVIRIDRPNSQTHPADALARSRTSISLNMKSSDGVAIARDLCRSADGIIEGYRPGVMERLGLGPAVLLADNPKLAYGRMTGWGQFGPLSHAAGHDINYIALSGVLHTIGRVGERPVPPVNYLGDFGGGGMMLAFGMVSAILSARNTGVGQVIDAAMTDGSAVLTAMTWSFKNMGMWADQTGSNMLDGAAHFYDSYACADGKFIAIGSIEPQFYAALLSALGLENAAEFAAQHDRSTWPDLKAQLSAIFAAQPRQYWCDLMEGTDICFAPILSLDEAPAHPHNAARQTFIDVGGNMQPAPAPRFSATPCALPTSAVPSGSDGAAILADLGYTADAIASLRASGAVG
jgi:alpha-methylacyl-CoA racemase